MRPTTVKKSTDHAAFYISTAGVPPEVEVNSVLKCEFGRILKEPSVVI